MSAAGRLEVLTDNDARLKKLLPGAMLRNAMLKDINAKNGDARREAADCESPLLKFLKSSQRRACAVIGVGRTSVRYRSVRPDDVAIRARLPELAILDDGFTYESIGRRAIYNGLNPVTIER